MAPKPLPASPDVDQLRRQAKDLHGSFHAGDAEALRRLRAAHPRFTDAGPADAAKTRLSDAQLVLAREHGFPSWPKLKAHVEKAQAALRLVREARQMRSEAIQRTERSLAEVRRAMAEAVDLARGPGGRPLIEALKGLGQVERDAGRAEEARALYEEATGLCRREGDPLLLAHTVRHLGDIHLDAGRLAEAERCLGEALALYRATPEAETLDMANAVRPVAILRELQGDLDAARRLWEEAGRLYAEARVKKGVTESQAHLRRL